MPQSRRRNEAEDGERRVRWDVLCSWRRSDGTHAAHRTTFGSKEEAHRAFRGHQSLPHEGRELVVDLLKIEVRWSEDAGVWVLEQRTIEAQWAGLLPEASSEPLPPAPDWAQDMLEGLLHQYEAQKAREGRMVALEELGRLVELFESGRNEVHVQLRKGGGRRSPHELYPWAFKGAHEPAGWRDVWEWCSCDWCTRRRASSAPENVIRAQRESWQP